MEMEGMTVSEAAERLGISREAVRKRVRRGSLPAVKGDDGQWLIALPDDVMAQDAWDIQSAPRTLSDAPDGAITIMLVSTLRGALDTLTAQLAIKDGQIEQLLALMADAQRLANRLLEAGH
jgi:excisionase family DNA binding protein